MKFSRDFNSRCAIGYLSNSWTSCTYLIAHSLRYVMYSCVSRLCSAVSGDQGADRVTVIKGDVTDCLCAGQASHGGVSTY